MSSRFVEASEDKNDDEVYDWRDAHEVAWKYDEKIFQIKIQKSWKLRPQTDVVWHLIYGKDFRFQPISDFVLIIRKWSKTRLRVFVFDH